MREKLFGDNLRTAFRNHNPTVTDPIRKDIATVGKLLRGRFRSDSHLTRKLARDYLRRSIQLMQGAAFMCLLVDLKAERGYDFLDRLRLRSPSQIESVEEFSRNSDLILSEDAATKEAWAANDIPRAFVNHWLHNVRNTLKEASPEATLLTFASGGTIQQMAELGHVSFFVELGRILDDAVKRRGSGSLRHANTQLILEAWISLNLGECGADGTEAHNRYQAYATALKQPTLGLTEFLTAWQNVRTKFLRDLLKRIKSLKVTRPRRTRRPKG